MGKALPPHDLVHLLVQGYNGLPIAGSQVFGDGSTSTRPGSVGVIGFAVGCAGSWSGAGDGPKYVAFTVLTVVTLAIVFMSPVQSATCYTCPYSGPLIGTAIS